MTKNQSPKKIKIWSIDYSDGSYCVIDPDGECVQKSLPISKSRLWKVIQMDGRYVAVDQDGSIIQSDDILDGYQIVELLSFGGSSLCYKAINKATGRIVVIKEFYPYSLAKEGLIFRKGSAIIETPNLDSKDQERVRAVFKQGFSQELEASDQIRFYQDTSAGLSNDPRFLSATPVLFEKQAGALNLYQVIDTQAGVFLDQVVFTCEDRNRVIDELSLIKQLLIAVRVLHNEKKRVHLDLKPENILISKAHVNEERNWGNHPVILIDFGSSLSVDDDGRITVDSDEIILTSTQEYAAPEVRNAAIGGDYSAIGLWSDVYSVFIILQRLLLSDADIEESDDISCESIRFSKSVCSLSPDEQDMLVELLRNGIETRKIDSADRMIEELNSMIDVLNNVGIHPVIIRKNARRLARQIQEREAIDKDLLCEVNIVNNS